MSLRTGQAPLLFTCVRSERGGGQKQSGDPQSFPRYGRGNRGSHEFGASCPQVQGCRVSRQDSNAGSEVHAQNRLARGMTGLARAGHRGFGLAGPGVLWVSQPPVRPHSSLCLGEQSLLPSPFRASGLSLGSFWLRSYPHFLGLTQRKKHFVKIAALLLNNLSSHSLFLFGRQKLNIDLWER